MRRRAMFVLVLVWSSVAAFTQTPGTAPASAPKAAAAPPRATTPAAKGTAAAAKPALASSSVDTTFYQKAKEEAAAAKASEERKKAAVDLVHEWFIRWNALGSNAPEAIDRFLELYDENATHEVGPNEKQASGPVYYRGQKLIRKMASDFANKRMDVAYSIAVQTRHEKSAELISTADMPWGSTELAVEYMGGQTDRDSKKRYMVRAGGFFEIQNGKIIRARIYMPREEISEVTGPFTIM